MLDRPSLRAAVWLCLLALLGACDSGSRGVGPRVASIVIDPDRVTAPVDTAIAFRAVVRDADGNVLSGRPVFWASSDTSVARISASNGMVETRAPGSASISASSDGSSAELASVVVVARPVASITVDPASASLPSLTDTVQLSAAVARDSRGTPLSRARFVWSSSAPGVAMVSSDGVVTAIANGTAVITARADDVAGTATISVAQRVIRISIAPSTATVETGGTVRYAASAFDGNGAPVPDGVLSWASGNPGVATVTPDGVASAEAIGTTTITASRDGASGSATLQVIPTAVSSVVLAPAAKAIIVGEATQLNASVRDAQNRPLLDRPVSWSSSNPGIAPVDAEGTVRGLAVGQTKIAATSGGKTGTAEITVRPIPVASIDVSPAAAELRIGEVRQLTATALSTTGNPLSGRPVAWASSSDLVRVDASGRVTAVRVGSTEVTATIEGKTGAARITVLPPPVATIEIAPRGPTLEVGESRTFVATTRDTQGNVLTDRAVHWASSAENVLSIDAATGNAVGRAVGDAVITATAEQKSASTPAQVLRAAVASVQVEPKATSIQVGDEQPFVATVYDARGGTLTGRTVEWKSTNGLVAPVDSRGVATGVTQGEAEIQALVEGAVGTASLRVIGTPTPTPPPPDPAPAVTGIQIVGGDNQTGRRNATLEKALLVRVVDATGTGVPNQIVRWSTADGCVATGSADNCSSSGRTISTRTNVVGVASVFWTLDGGASGSEKSAIAEVDSGSGATVRVTFHARLQ